MLFFSQGPPNERRIGKGDSGGDAGAGPDDDGGRLMNEESELDDDLTKVAKRNQRGLTKKRRAFPGR